MFFNRAIVAYVQIQAMVNSQTQHISRRMKDKSVTVGCTSAATMARSMMHTELVCPLKLYRRYTLSMKANITTEECKYMIENAETLAVPCARTMAV